jgi:hypothetical protein
MGKDDVVADGLHHPSARQSNHHPLVLSRLRRPGLVDNTVDRWSAALLVIGVFLGSALWWLLLTGAVGLARHRMGTARLLWMNRL